MQITEPLSDMCAIKNGITAFGKPPAIWVCDTGKMGWKRLFALRPQKAAFSPIYVDPFSRRFLSASSSGWFFWLEYQLSSPWQHHLVHDVPSWAFPSSPSNLPQSSSATQGLTQAFAQLTQAQPSFGLFLMFIPNKWTPLTQRNRYFKNLSWCT